MNASTALGYEDPPGQPRVLLVDDDEVNLLLTSIALRERGFAITEATSGERAIQVLADWLPDVVVLDAMMPGMDGFEVARRLRAMPEGRDVLLVAQTGWGQEEERARTKAAGFDVHLAKPVDVDALMGLLG